MTVYSDLSSVDPPPRRAARAGRHGRVIDAPGTRLAVAALVEATRKVDQAARDIRALAAEADATAGELARRIDALEGEALQLRSLAASASKTLRARTRRSPLAGAA